MTGYRDHGHALACGMEPNAVMAELFGKDSGCSGGKGGSMHLFDAEKHMLGGNGIVGAHIPVATGVALKLKNEDEKGVVLCYFGDGAIHQGSFRLAPLPRQASGIVGRPEDLSRRPKKCSHCLLRHL